MRKFATGISLERSCDVPLKYVTDNASTDACCADASAEDLSGAGGRRREEELGERERRKGRVRERRARGALLGVQRGPQQVPREALVAVLGRRASNRGLAQDSMDGFHGRIPWTDSMDE